MTLQVKEGDKLNITCRISLEASSTIVWMRDNIPVHTGQSMFLFIASVNRSQAGNYICVSLSPTGNRTSAITAVNVLCKYNNAVKSFTSFFFYPGGI